MKKILQITIGIIALGFIVVIAKNTLFTSADEKWYNEGWNAHEKGDYNTAIFYFNRLDKTKYPDVYVGLGSSYMNTGDFKNAIQNFLEAYKKNIGKGTQDYNKIRNSLGYCYLQIRDYRNARVYFNEAKQLGNENSNINLQILDSLEQKKGNKLGDLKIVSFILCSATEIKFETGSSSITMSNDGNITIKGLNVTIEGTNTNVIGTSVATLGKNGANPGVKVDGNVTIKGGQVDIN